jgi:hypothetical protein
MIKSMRMDGQGMLYEYGRRGMYIGFGGKTRRKEPIMNTNV